MVKPINEFEKEFFDLLSKYTEEDEEIEYDLPTEHDLYELLRNCEEFITSTNDKIKKMKEMRR